MAQSLEIRGAPIRDRIRGLKVRNLQYCAARQVGGSVVCVLSFMVAVAPEGSLSGAFAGKLLLLPLLLLSASLPGETFTSQTLRQFRRIFPNISTRIRH